MTMSLISKARARILIDNIFFATLVLSTKLVEDKRIPTAATNGRVIKYNPDFLEELGDIKVVIFVLVHEIGHIMLKHVTRRGHRNPRRWNIACDHAINLMLRDCGFTLWDKCYADPRFKGMSAEQIYDILQDEHDERVRSGKGKGTPGGDEPCDGMGDDIQPEEMTPDEIAEVEREVGRQVAQAASMARMAGKMPGAIEKLIDQILNPVVPWQDLLREYMTRILHDDETWMRRNKRFQRIYLPTRWSERMGEIVMIGDTSGSVHGDNGYYARIGGEMNYLADIIKPERVRMIWADDTDCANEEVFEPGDEIVLHPKGGGGTDMRKPLQFVERYNPEIVVLITDCYTPWPDEEPPYPLIVLSTTNEECPWGNTIHIPTHE